MFSTIWRLCYSIVLVTQGIRDCFRKTHVTTLTVRIRKSKSVGNFRIDILGYACRSDRNKYNIVDMVIRMSLKFSAYLCWEWGKMWVHYNKRYGSIYFQHFATSVWMYVCMYVCARVRRRDILCSINNSVAFLSGLCVHQVNQSETI